MITDLLADYRRRGWTLVPVPARAKGTFSKEWQTRRFEPSDFPASGNVAVLLGPRSGELVDIDLDCDEALALADIYLPPTGAEFGRLSKPRSHRLYVAPGACFQSFGDPKAQKTILELRARGATGGEHMTLVPPSIADGERREWHGDTIEPAPFDAAKLHRRCAYLAIGCLVRRYVSVQASERPAPDLANVLFGADPILGRVGYRWLGLPDPDAPQWRPKQRHDYTRAEIDLAELVASIPNDCDWHGWSRVGMAIFAASDGSDQGGIIFDTWSSKSAKYDPYATVARWRHWYKSPPSKLTAGTLVYLARQAGWQPPRSRETA